MIRRGRGRSTVMDDKKNEKSVEELTDEVLDTVTGGKRDEYVRATVTCPKCHQPKERLVACRDPKDPTKHESMCPDCARDLGYV